MRNPAEPQKKRERKVNMATREVTYVVNSHKENNIEPVKPNASEVLRTDPGREKKRSQNFLKSQSKSTVSKKKTANGNKKKLTVIETAKICPKSPTTDSILPSSLEPSAETKASDKIAGRRSRREAENKQSEECNSLRKSILDTKLPPIEDYSRRKVSRRVKKSKRQINMIPSAFRKDSKIGDEITKIPSTEALSVPQPLPRMKKFYLGEAEDSGRTELPATSEDPKAEVKTYQESRPIPLMRSSKIASDTVSERMEKTLARVQKHYSNLVYAGKNVTSIQPPKPIPRGLPPGNKLKSLQKDNSAEEREDGQRMQQLASSRRAKFAAIHGTRGLKASENLLQSAPLIHHGDSEFKQGHTKSPSEHGIGFSKPFSLFSGTRRKSVDGVDLSEKDVIRKQTTLVREKRNRLSLTRKLAAIEQ